jgi:ribosomal protein S18 acetylase RimI-like enzyme
MAADALPLDDPLRALSERTVAVGTPEPMGVYAFRVEDPGAPLALSVERQVFLEAFGNTPELLASEYEAYDPASVFLTVLDHRRNVPAGMMRILVPSMAGLKSLNDIELIWGEHYSKLFERSGLVYDEPNTWDIATLAVAPDYRGVAQSGLVSIALYQTLSMVAQRCGVRQMVAILHEPVLKLLQRKFRGPFVVLGDVPARAYLGSPASIAVIGDMEEWLHTLEEADPILYEVMHDGEGMQPAIRPPDWDEIAAMFHTVHALADAVRTLADSVL